MVQRCTRECAQRQLVCDASSDCDVRGRDRQLSNYHERICWATHLFKGASNHRLQW